MPYKEPKVEKLFYSIGEVARMFEVNTSLIRFWEKEFDIIKPKKNKKGNRLFTKEDIDNFHIIQVSAMLQDCKNIRHDLARMVFICQAVYHGY